MPDVSTSQRFGYVQPLLQELDPENQDYIFNSVVDSESFDGLPLDVQLWIESAEKRVGVAMSNYAEVQAQEASIDEKMP